MVKVHYSSRQTSGNRVGNYRKPTNKAERKPDIDVKYALDGEACDALCGNQTSHELR